VGVAASIDRFQRRFPPLGFPLAVIYKFFDDQGNQLAAVVTYYAFVAIFPLMLLGSSILGFVLEDRPHLQEALLDTALSQFPIIGDELGRPDGLRGSTSGVVIGSLVATYGAMGLGLAIQNVVNAAWSVPRNSRPNPIMLRLRSLLLLLTAGLALLAVSLVSALFTNTELLGGLADWWPLSLPTWLVPVLSALVVGGMLTLLLRVAAARDHPLLGAAPGGFAIAAMWQAVQWLGAQFVTGVINRTEGMNQTFALVLGLVGFLYVVAVVGVLGIEINVVLVRRLWPRALLTPFTDRVDLTDADRRAYASYALMQRHKGFETVAVSFEGRDGDTHEIVMDPSWARKGHASAGMDPRGEVTERVD